VRGVSIQLALRTLRANSAQTGVKLPPRLTVAVDEPSYQEWLSEIDSYRRDAVKRKGFKKERAGWRKVARPEQREGEAEVPRFLTS
jgi:hypothetical protein